MRQRKPMATIRQSSLVLLLCAVLSGAGCSSGGGSRPPPPADDLREPASSPSNPPESIERGLPAPNASDGRDYRTTEYTGHWGLGGINAEPAYQRGYFGQGVTIAVVGNNGIDTTHSELASRITGARDLNNDDTDVSPTDSNAHDTYVALLAAGARGNSGGPFLITGTSMRSKNFHGVAPQASVIPIQMSGGLNPVHPDEAIRYATSNGAFAVNFSLALNRQYWGRLTGRDGIWNTASLPYFRPLIARWLRDLFSESAQALRERDTVVVFAASNDGWNSLNNRVSLCGRNSFNEEGCTLGRMDLTAEEFMQEFEWLPTRQEGGSSIAFRDMWGADCGRDDCAEYNSPGGWKEAPLFEPDLLGKWLVVVATREDGNLASFSNGCGSTRNFCLAAPGDGLTLGPESRRPLAGTSFAAPLASGALAVLRSRLPAMPAETVLALLLYSADPVGSRIDNPDEPDPVYGWGHLNLGRAITQQGALRLPYSVVTQDDAAPSGVSLQGAHLTLSPAFAHAAHPLGGVQFAVGGVGNAYYNMELGQLIDIEGRNLPVQGYAAADMLEPAGGPLVKDGAHDYGLFIETGSESGEAHAYGLDVAVAKLGDWRLRHHLCDVCGTSAWRNWNPRARYAAIPFFAYREGAISLQMLGTGLRPFVAVSGREASAPWRQYGLRWRQQEAGYDISAELSRTDEDQSIWGMRFGAFSGASTTTRQIRLLGSVPLFSSWRGLVGYEHLSAIISVDGHFLSSITDLEATGWSAGIEGWDVFRGDDIVRFSAQQKTVIHSGQARINHVVATGASFVDAFYRGRPQSLTQRQTVVALHSPSSTRYAVGYALPVTSNNKTRAAFGLEYEGGYGTGAISFALRHEF